MLFHTPRAAAQPLAQWRPTPMAVLCPFLRMGACPQPLVPCMVHVSCSSAPNSTSNIKLERMDGVPALPGRRFFCLWLRLKYARGLLVLTHCAAAGWVKNRPRGSHGKENRREIPWAQNRQASEWQTQKKHNNQAGSYSTQSAM